MKKLLLIFAICTITVSCQVIEEGEIDYVRTKANDALDTKNLTLCNQDLYAKSELTRAGVTRDCYETLYRKYTTVPQIPIGETISVHLMQAFNGFAIESQNLSERLRNLAANAEIVVIANVCEQGKTGCSMAFGPSSDKSGRVIFYSNGVKALQYLNFSYLPVYGPIEYEGGPLVIQISIVELDDPSDQQKAMLKTLAATGQKMYPPASSALSVLDSVGTAILSNSSDDIIFRYSMTLVPQSNSENYHSPIVAEGNYAFIRKNTRKGPQEKEVFDELMFDNLSGRLVQDCTKKETEMVVKTFKNGRKREFDYSPCKLELNTGKMVKDYRANTYLTFQIKSGFLPKTLDNLQTFEELKNDINLAADESAQVVINQLMKLSSEFSAKESYNQLLSKLSNVKSKLAEFPDDLYDIFELETYELIDLYEVVLAELDTEKCYTNAANDSCTNLMTKHHLIKFQREFRSLLKLINPNPANPIDSMIESGPTALSKKAELISAFKNGYKKFYNKSFVGSLEAELQVITNLTTNIKRLALENKNIDYIDKRKVLLNKKLSQFLYNFAESHNLRVQASCSAITSNSCYLYLFNVQSQKLASSFNFYASQNGVVSANLLNFTNDAALTTSLSPAKIELILKDVSNSL